MIVTVRNWTLLRPVRIAWRAHKVSKRRASEAREARSHRGFFDDYAAMMTHAADLAIRNMDTE